MSSFDKVVKLACKPKAAPPKAKYLDPIIAATWSDDGAVHDVCKALSPRFREPNTIVVFKALIVLHTMIRNGSTDNVLGHLSSNEVLRLKNVSSTNWEGYTPPQNLQHYAIYLDARIRAYAELKHDAIRVQSESNRDMRNSMSIEEDQSRHLSPKSASGPARSKTVIGRKLRMMTVEKGLLRETKVVHKMIDSLVECRFYLDDLEDELTITALRMLVKDLLILFQAGNEGVINLLEHYFEMSHHDAEDALAIYRKFCKQTEKVVEYLGVAKKLQNLLNVPIPNLKHAPVSLAGSLQEYLDDPNFEQNRVEYKANKAAVDKSTKRSNGSTTTTPKEDKASASKDSTIKASSTSTSTTEKPTFAAEKDVIDFFSSIEEQTTVINPATAFPNAAAFGAQGVVNPFMQRQMVTGQPFVQNQMTGFPAFQQPAGVPNPFTLTVQEAPQQQTLQFGGGHRPFSSYLPTQATGMFPLQQQPQQTGFLQPQATGANPFRQSVLVPQQTATPAFPFGNDAAIQNAGMNAFSSTTPQPQGPFAISAQSQGPFGTQPGNTQAQNPFPNPPNVQNTQPPPFVQTNPGSTASPFAPSNNQGPARPASTPLVASSNGVTPPFLKTHQTGSKNPFGRVVTPPPPVPELRQPTMMEIAMGFGQQQQQQQQQQQPVNNAFQPQSQNQTSTANASSPTTNGSNPFGFNTGALAVGGTNMSSVASSFAFNKTSTTMTSTPTLNPQTTASTTTSSAFSDSLFSSMASQPTGTTNSAGSPTLRPQTTGFAPLKTFKPSSSFGASLMESLPPVPSLTSSNSTSSTIPDTPTTTTGSLLTPLSGFSALNTQPTGFKSSVGVGLRPQMTGNAANPFRASMAGGAGAGATGAFGSNAFGHQQPPPVPSLPGAFSGFGSGAAFGASSMGQNMFSAMNAGTPTGANNQQQPASAQQASLI